MYLSNVSRQRRRPGKVVAMFAMALPALLGMLAIIIDGGMGLGFHRQLQNATDAAAKAAALQLFQDWHLPQATREANARATATAFIATHHGYTGAVPVVTFGAAMGEPRYNTASEVDYYVKVSLTRTVNTWLAHVFGSTSTTLTTESIAGFEHHNNPSRWPEFREGVIALDPRATAPDPPTSPHTGLIFGNRSRLEVNGSVVVNARGIGFDQYQSAVTYGFPSRAITIPSNATLKSRYVQVRGGVQNPVSLEKYNNNDPHLFFGRAGIVPDPFATNRPPFRYLPIPVSNVEYGNVAVRPGNPRTLDPGIYDDIEISRNASVTFRSGVYIMRPGDYRGIFGLRVPNGSATIRATGPVMFYFTDYFYHRLNPNDPARYDRTDGAMDYDYVGERIPDSSGPSVNLAILDLNLTRTDIRLQGLPSNDPNWPGILFFQRRHSVGIGEPSEPPFNDETQRFRIYGNQMNNSYLRGAIYAKWGTMRLGGTATYSEGQFVVGNMILNQNADITVNNIPANRYTARKTFLVQ